jgi:hypothetical protein
MVLWQAVVARLESCLLTGLPFIDAAWARGDRVSRGNRAMEREEGSKILFMTRMCSF